jgi:hypothetical protein
LVRAWRAPPLFLVFTAAFTSSLVIRSRRPSSITTRFVLVATSDLLQLNKPAASAVEQPESTCCRFRSSTETFFGFLFGGSRSASGSSCRSQMMKKKKKKKKFFKKKKKGKKKRKETKKEVIKKKK